MTHYDFVTWLKGFASAANSYNITPKQWESIIEKLDSVTENVEKKLTVDKWTTTCKTDSPITYTVTTEN